MPCPVYAGKHPLHDCRYIVTGDAIVEFSPYRDGDWRLESGSMICQMRDIPNQRELATLFAAAPELLEALEALVGEADLGEVDLEPEELEKLERARAAISKAKGIQ